jgi:ubiquinone/menaquinone biosynthesis C-methylase UbiE
MPADWQLPPGVSRSLWEFAADEQLPQTEEQHLGQAPLLRFDHALVDQWFERPGRVIDLGCGTGRSVAALARRGFECTGVDLSQPSLRVAQERLQREGLAARLLRGNLCELEFLPDGQFDYALLLFGTLGMVSGSQSRRQVLAHAHRLLVPGGRLALHVHSLWPHLFQTGGRGWLLRDLAKRLAGSPTAGDTHRDYRGIPRIYHHVFSRRELHRLLRDTGFDITREIPLAPLGEFTPIWPPGTQPADKPTPPVPESLAQTGLFRNLRCTGWMVEVRRG